MSAPATSYVDYTREIAFHAPAERVFDALTTLEGLAGWWTPIVSGNPKAGGELKFGFAGLDESIVMHVDKTSPPSAVVWTCLTNTGHPEWEGTRITFTLQACNESGGVLRFRHVGLIPRLTCYETCENGWERFLASLVQYGEHGNGSPFPMTRRR
jgi:uncharacterized protein YndB with AHSA1/START domain